MAPGVYAWIGALGEPDAANRGAVGNGGLIVGSRASLLVNSGGSYLLGREMIEAAERLGGGRPIVAAVIQQPLQEFLMGNAALRERGIPLIAHAEGARLIGQRCDTCLRNLERDLGPELMRGTRVVVPERTLGAASEEIDLGERRVTLLHPGWGTTPGDLVVFDHQSGVLFAGALVGVGRLPELRDARLPGWLAALDGLQALRPRIVVPGYGPVGAADADTPMRDYLQQLDLVVGGLVDSGVSLIDAPARAPMPAYAGWSRFDAVHPRNVQQLYLRHEAEWLGAGRSELKGGDGGR
ncbi:MBL fold metallo-hydrolase [Rivibacter subsaxonicus]|uniref:Glyoxylase-like metal-dependent hydrolase (Beta-lactamase superfamily II) n=1 Tax=Rivibacter subsaxonicus TaxID=457575 RepID=A0A4Q7W048_9BURK|nr:MBL fold metallo-hydrolase [Rivibacter subsaxonicus]RZU02228.1 glyoxylase-like metal-dependent hydrolase (beta-lactamase superfamily II) [Rivibacter subsaxonicus]